LVAHNAYPVRWPEAIAERVDEEQTIVAVRSGWPRSAATASLVSAGRVRADFDPERGLPSIVPRLPGPAASGVSAALHEVDAAEADPELWSRWIALGTYSPVLLGGEIPLDDSTLRVRWAQAAREHTRLHPYRHGLAARAAEHGI